jgi:hypothetical protein
MELAISLSLLGLLVFLPRITWFSWVFCAVCVMTFERGTTVNFANITSEGFFPPSEEAQTLKDSCYKVCACPDIACVRGCEKGEIWRVDTKFVV